ncbi:unnamed protein product, partial [marine sediment metagenome]
IEYRAGDDGAYQAGWWQGLKIADNKTRFIAKRINYNDVVIDLATGLMWPASGNKCACNEGLPLNWEDAITYALDLTFAGFTDWRLPNIIELLSIIDFSLANPAIKDPPFKNTQSLHYWSSSTYKGIITKAWTCNFLLGITATTLKTESKLLRCVRDGV